MSSSADQHLIVDTRPVAAIARNLMSEVESGVDAH